MLGIHKLSTPTSCKALQDILLEYKKASGQKINNNTKSSITFSSKTPPENKETAKLILDISKERGRENTLVSLSTLEEGRRTLHLSC